MNPWTLELLVVRDGAFAVERRTLARDVERGLLTRVRPGVYVARAGWEPLSVEQRHVVLMRALTAVTREPPVFSHWSAAVLHGLPVLRARLDRVHTTVPDPGRRGLTRVFGHVAPIEPDRLVRFGPLVASNAVRTTVDIGLAGPFREGVMAADGALRAGLAREVLLSEIERAADRRGVGRARRVAAFARTEAESAAESQSRVSMLELRIRPPELQFEVFDRQGLAGRLDFWFPWLRVGGEVDGEKKYLDAALAPDGAARAVISEKRREDRVRSEIERLARWGWPQALSAQALGPVLGRAGVRSADPPASFEDYCAAALDRV